MTIRFHSPLPPARTGVADYSALLMEGLSKLASVVANPEGDKPGDVDLYHIGNNDFHSAIYARALARPGVSVVHDAVLQHFYLGSLTREDYVAELIHNYGEWHREFAETLWRERDASPSDARYFEWPMLRRVAERSLGVIVHNPAAAQMIRRHAPGTPVEIIPHLFVDPPKPAPEAVAKLRASWGAGDDTLLIGVFGFLRETKRIPSVLRAFERARMHGANVALLISGEFVSKNLEASLGAALHQRGVIRCGYAEEADFWMAAHAVDLCVNLRVPSAGESSGIATRMMGIGKAVALTEGPEVSHYPSGSYLPVSASNDEARELERYFLSFALRPELTREIGAQARAHVLRNQSVDRVARLYVEFLQKIASVSSRK